MIPHIITAIEIAVLLTTVTLAGAVYLWMLALDRHAQREEEDRF